MTTHIVILNFGGPRAAEEVEPFLFELFNDPDVIHLPLGGGFQKRFAGWLSSRRAPTVVSHYAHIGFSPLVQTTLEQVEALRAALGSDAPPVHVAMRYTEPRVDGVVQALQQAKPTRIVALALYPHFSDTTTGSSFNEFSAALTRGGLGHVPVQYVPAFYEDVGYIEAMADRIREAGGPSDAFILFSAHGLPSTYLREDSDPYPGQIQESVRLIAGALGRASGFGLAFQSQVGPIRWLKPSTEEALSELARTGVKDVVVVPISFVTEGIETLYEIDELFGEVATRLGLTMHRVKTVDTHPAFIDCLKRQLESCLADERHSGLGQHRCVRCLLPKNHLHRTKSRCVDCGHRTPPYLLRLPPAPV